jgi:hypothetical protein
MIHKYKNIVAKQKNQNGGFVQDGNEIIFYFMILSNSLLNHLDEFLNPKIYPATSIIDC